MLDEAEYVANSLEEVVAEGDRSGRRKVGVELGLGLG